MRRCGGVRPWPGGLCDPVVAVLDELELGVQPDAEPPGCLRRETDGLLTDSNGDLAFPVGSLSREEDGLMNRLVCDVPLTRPFLKIRPEEFENPKVFAQIEGLQRANAPIITSLLQTPAKVDVGRQDDITS